MTDLHAKRARTALRICAVAGLLVALTSTALAGENAELRFHRGVVAFGDARYDDARADFEKILADDPEDTSALQYLALIAHAEGDANAAIVLYRRALEIDADDAEIRLDLGISLLDVADPDAARAEFDQVIELEPTRARAHLMGGIAAYRAGDYNGALPYLDKSVELDPSLRTEARYYTGLCQVLLRRYELADGAFGDVELQAPITPLGESARQMREQLRENPDEDRRWWVAISLGAEGDSNPTVAGAPLSRDPDGRIVLRPQAEYTLWERDGNLVSMGYDGYISFHFDEHDVDLNTHAGFLQGSTSLGPVYASLRYDYAATWIDLSDPFRQVHRVIPSLSFPLGEIGVTELYYQFIHQNFDDDPLPATVPNGDRTALYRTGNENVIAANHYFFLPVDWADYVRIGALGDFYNADGSDYSYRGWEVSAAVAAPLPFGFSAIALYRYTERNFRNSSIFPPNVQRNDEINRLSLDFVKPIGVHWELSLNGNFNWVDSNIPAYDFNRYVGGAYITYVY